MFVFVLLPVVFSVKLPVEFQLLHIGGGTNQSRMNGIRFGILNAWCSGGLCVVDSHITLTKLALLGQYRDGLGWSVMRSSTVNTTAKVGRNGVRIAGQFLVCFLRIQKKKTYFRGNFSC